MTVLRAHWDRATAALAAFAGFVVLLLGWVGVSGEGLAAKQLPYMISGGIGGIFLLGLAAVLWLSADLRDEWRVLEEIRAALTDQDPAEPGADHAATAELSPVPVRPAEATQRWAMPPTATPGTSR